MYFNHRIFKFDIIKQNKNYYVIFTDFDTPIQFSKKELKNVLIYNGIADIEEELQEFLIRELAKTPKEEEEEMPEIIIESEPAPQFNDAVQDLTLEQRLSRITSSTLEVNKEINNAANNTNKDIDRLYKEAARNFNNYEAVKDNSTGIFTGMFGIKSEANKKLITAQSSIDALFKVISLELENTEAVGTKFQEMVVTLEQEQIPALIALAEESDKTKASYTDEALIPFNVVRTNTSIHAELERLKKDQLNLRAGITITQGTVTDLAGKLPSIKAGIESGTAFGLELDKLTNVYDRMSGATNILMDINNRNSEAIHSKVGDIFKAQLNDTSLITNVRSAGKHTNNLAKTVEEGVTALAAKYTEEAAELNEIKEASLALGTTSKLKQLGS